MFKWDENLRRKYYCGPIQGGTDGNLQKETEFWLDENITRSCAQSN